MKEMAQSNFFGSTVIPLATRLRPKTLDEITGQKHLLAPGAPLRVLIESKKLSSVILWGPAGTGKTTIARVIASYGNMKFISLNATSASVKDIRREGEAAKDAGVSSVIFVDECLSYNSLVIIKINDKIVLMPIGYIVDNRINGDVLSYDVDTKIYEWQPIISWNVTNSKPTIEIVFEEDGIEFILRCSEDHLIYTKNRGYIKANNLDVNDEVVSPIKDIMKGEYDFAKALQDMFKGIRS